ncbi:hypothetical protein CDD80_274 [Ophiocordyceps camponoti-rufipedis]|uniref:Uncharacterized protein n=1 Tax=Ophiocordyceps camponoti-rufipedis TaxID=2004952 RepID=A0A2C5XQ90_9HYPO|nr:hypothetical protein CDD80_274 [Ophiocordyceps camponoti-rufipedis]
MPYPYWTSDSELYFDRLMANHVKLKGRSNWDNWFLTIETYVEDIEVEDTSWEGLDAEKNAKSLLDGTCKRPEPKSAWRQRQMEVWDKTDKKIKRALFLTLNDDMAKALVASGWTKNQTAHETLEALRKISFNQNADSLFTNVQDLTTVQELFELRAHNFPTIEAFNAKLKHLLNQIKFPNDDLRQVIFNMMAILGIQKTHKLLFQDLKLDWSNGWRPIGDEIPRLLGSLHVQALENTQTPTAIAPQPEKRKKPSSKTPVLDSILPPSALKRKHHSLKTDTAAPPPTKRKHHHSTKKSTQAKPSKP